jgi:hypothetical protein
MTEHEYLVLIAETKVARQKELVCSLEVRLLDATEAKSTLAGLRYSLRLLKEKQRRHDEPRSQFEPGAAKRRLRWGARNAARD